jgi:protein arginine N-methyltransferase 1
VELGPPEVFHAILYDGVCNEQIDWQGRLAINHAGTLNAVRVITKNLLAIIPDENRSVDWLMNYLVVPLEEPQDVEAGTRVEIALDYNAGDPLTSLTPRVRCPVTSLRP